MKLEQYNTLFTVFLIITIILVIISFVLFFLLDIRGILRVKMGVAKKKPIKKSKAVNEKKEVAKKKSGNYCITEIKAVRASNEVIRAEETEYLWK